MDLVKCVPEPSVFPAVYSDWPLVMAAEMADGLYLSLPHVTVPVGSERSCIGTARVVRVAVARVRRASLNMATGGGSLRLVYTGVRRLPYNLVAASIAHVREAVDAWPETTSSGRTTWPASHAARKAHDLGGGTTLVAGGSWEGGAISIFSDRAKLRIRSRAAAERAFAR
jgi:hypothetical protein